MKCSNCGNEITEGQRFCINCGAPVPQTQGCDETAPDAAPVAEQIVEAEAEEIKEPVTERTAEPVAEQAAMVEQPAESVAEQCAEPVAEQTAGPAAEEPKESQTAAPVEPKVNPAEPKTEEAAANQTAYSTAKSAEAILASIPKDYKPLPVWQFLCFEVLFSIPIIGVIASLIFSLEASKNVNLINFARARFLWTVVETLLTLIAFVMALVRFL